jgi:MFS family permease
MTKELAFQKSCSRATNGWWMAIVLGLAGVVAYIARLILSSLLDPIRGELRITDSEISLLQGAAFAVVYAFAALPLGRLADRHRRLTILTISAVVWSLGVVGCGLAPDFWSLFVCRLVVGVGEAALVPAGVSMLADVFPIERRGTAVGILMIGCALGVPAAYAVGGELLQLAQGGAFAQTPALGGLTAWRQVLVIIGVAGMIVPLLFLSLREPTRKGITESEASLRATVTRFWTDRKMLIPLYLGMALLSIGDFSLYSWLPSVLYRKFHFSPHTAGLWLGGIVAISSVVGMGLGGILADWAARRGGLRARLKVSAIASGLAVVGALLVSGPGAAFALAGLGVWVFTGALAFTSAYVGIQTVIPAEHRAVGLGLVAFCNILLGLGLGPTLVALTTDLIFGDPQSIGFAITAVAFPAGIVACVLFVYAGLITWRVPHMVQTALSEPAAARASGATS